MTTNFTSEQYVFLKSGLAHGIAGFFTWAALFITGHQVSDWNRVFVTVNGGYFRYINTYVTILAPLNKDGLYEFFLLSRFMHSILG